MNENGESLPLRFVLRIKCNNICKVLGLRIWIAIHMLLSTYSTLPVDYLFYFFHPIMHKVKSLVATYFFKAGLERSVWKTPWFITIYLPWESFSIIQFQIFATWFFSKKLPSYCQIRNLRLNSGASYVSAYYLKVMSLYNIHFTS